MKSRLVASFVLSALLAWSGPVADRPASVVVETICAACHGANLTGGSAPNLLDERWNHGGDDAAIRQSVLEGWPATCMPAFKEVLSSGEVQGILERLRADGRAYAGGRIQPPPTPPPEPSPRRGSSLAFGRMSRRRASSRSGSHLRSNCVRWTVSS